MDTSKLTRSKTGSSTGMTAGSPSEMGTSAQPWMACTKASGVVVGSVRGNVLERSTGVALSDVNVFAYRPGEDGPYVQWQTDVGQDTRPDGSFEGTLPTGRWDLVVHAEGRPVSGKVP